MDNFACGFTLTSGAISRILEGQFVFEPIVQVLAYKQLPEGSYESTDSSGPRYRLMISDGTSTHQNCIVSNQELVAGIRGGQFEKFTIIKITNYNKKEVVDQQGFARKFIYAINIEVLKPGSEVRQKLGNPSLARDQNQQQQQPPMQQQQQPPMQQQFAHAQQQQQQGSYNGMNNGNNFQNNQQQQPPSGSHNNGANSNQAPPFGNQYASPMKTNHQPVMPLTPSNRAISDQAVIDIASLTPYIGKWVIKARVTQKGQIRTYSNTKGEGKLFSFTLADKTGELKVSAFNMDCDKWFSFISPNKVYYLSRAQIKAANKRYTTADYECTLNSDSVLEECLDTRANEEVPSIRYKFVSLGSLNNHPVDQPVDLIGIIERVDEWKTITSKTKNKELKKRNVTIVDMSRHDISVTVWGDEAETFTGQVGQVIVLKGARLSDFGGRSASAGDSILLDPDLPETRKMKNWFENVMDTNFTHLTNSQDNTDSGAAEWRSLKVATDIDLFKESGAIPTSSMIKATILMVGQRPIYRSCAIQGCGKKLEEAETGDWLCKKCNQTFQTFKCRYKADLQISDATGTTWITLWDEKAENLLGYKPDELHSLMQHDKEKERYEKIMQAPNFKTFIFTIRSGLHTYNDKESLRHTVTGISPCDYVKYGSKLVEDIKLMGQSL